MLRITIEIIPFGLGEPVVLHRGIISNDLTGDPSNGNYKVRLGKRKARKLNWKIGELIGFPRKRKNAWYLLRDALNAVLGDT